MKRRKKVSGAEQTRKSWRYPGDKLNRNLLGRTSGLSTRARAEPALARNSRGPRDRVMRTAAATCDKPASLRLSNR